MATYIVDNVTSAGRDYATLAAAISDTFSASEDVILEIRNNAAYNETLTTWTATAINSMVIRPASGVKHDGTAGSGARIVNTGNHTWAKTWALTFEDLEFDWNAGEPIYGLDNQGGGTLTVRRCILHNILSTTNAHVACIATLNSSATTVVEDCLFYDLENTYGFASGRARAIHGAFSSTTKAYNNTIVDVTANAGTAYGIDITDISGSELKNNLVTGTNATTAADYSISAPSNITTATNGSSDATSPESGLRSLSISYNAAGSNDYSLGSGDTGAHTAGSGTSTSGITSTDIIGTARGTSSASLGAFEYAAGSGLSASITLTERDGTRRQDLTNIKWAWFDETDPQNFNAPTDTGIVETTDVEGLIEVSLSGTSLVAGQYGCLALSTSDNIDLGLYKLRVK